MSIIKSIETGKNSKAIIETYDNEIFYYSHVVVYPETGQRSEDNILMGTKRKCENALKKHCECLGINYI